MGKQKREPVGKRLLSLLMVMAMVVTSLAVAPVTAKAADANSVKLYFELPTDTSVTDWCVNVWSEAKVTEGDTENAFRPASWGATGDKYPTLLADANLSGWGYVTISGTITGLQFVNKEGTTVYECWNKQIANDSYTEAYFSPSDRNWYTSAEKSKKIEEPAKAYVTMHIKGKDAWKKPVIHHWSDKLELTGTDGTVNFWNSAHDVLKAEENGFFSITAQGTFGGFLFADAEAETETKTPDIAAEDIALLSFFTGSTPTDVYYIQDASGSWAWYMDAEGTEKMVAQPYVTMHLKADGWTTPAMQHWNDTLDITGSSGQKAIPGWGVNGELLTADGDGFYSITVRGSFGGFQFLDIDNADGTKTGDSTYNSLLNNFKKTTPTDVYYIKDTDGTWNWYMDAAGTITLESTKPVAEKATDNIDGTTIFTTIVEGNPEKVQVAYAAKADVEEKGEDAFTTVDMTADAAVNNAYNSDSIYFGDDKLDICYYFIVNGEKKAVPEDGKTTVNGVECLEYTRDEFKGRKLTVPGTLVDDGAAGTWDPSINVMTYLGNGLYEFTFHNVAPANYEYKIATGSWSENYGAGGVKDGSNIAVTVPTRQDVKVWYSDFSHYSKCSLNYTFGATLKLTGTGIPEGTTFGDSRLTGVYSAVVPNMATGTYTDTKIELGDDKTIAFDSYTVDTQKDVTFYYDPESGVYYSDASDATVDTSKVHFDSKDESMKAPFGAVATGTEVTYNIETGTDVTDVRLIVKGTAKQNIKMTKKGEAADGKQMWTATTSFDKLGEYKYFFAVYNGTAAVMYGDDDGYYGEGKATDLLNLLPYDQIVYQSGYKTPDWMKNAVVYQIFPDRFYNGDTTNDTITTDARGNVQYEYMRDWYILPENPEQETADRIETYPTYAYKGDGNWSNEIYGGDLKGITKRIDYLKALGVTVIYMNPVFESISSHRYDTSDYKNIDPILGTLGDFEELVKVADENGMKIVLDGVFNHVSDDSVYFDRYYEYLEAGTDTIGAYPYWAYVYDYMAENAGADQATAEAAAKEYFSTNYGITNFDYVEWFDVFTTTLKDDEGEEVCDSYGLRAGKPVYGYDGWWGYDSMPIIKATSGSEYQTGTWAEDVIGTNETSTTADNSVTQYWLSKGMDGWRLDVANEVSDETWQHFRKSVKALNSDNVIIGEIWTDAVQYLMGDMYDSVMNYMFRGAVINFVKSGDSITAINTLERLRERYPKEAFYAMMNLVDSHDTTRILSYLDGIDDDRNQKDVDSAFPTYENTSDTAKQMQYLVALMQFTYAGAPTIYYGDELGMVGADDPDDRRAMIWGKGNKELVEWYAKLAAIRSKYSALRTGEVAPVYAVDDNAAGDNAGKPSKNLLSYVRSDSEDVMLVMMNNSDKAITSTVSLADAGINKDKVTDVISGTSYDVTDGKLTIEVPAYRGVILVDSAKAVAAEVNTEALKPGYDPAYIVPVIADTPSEPDTPSKPGNTTVTKNPDGTTTETKKETTKNKAGKEVAVTTTTNKDAKGNVTGSKKVSVIAGAAKDTSVTVGVVKNAQGKITTAKAKVNTTGTKSKTSITGVIYGSVVSQITEAAGTTNVEISVTVKAGTKSYIVKVNAGDLKAGTKLKVVAVDSKTKKYILVNSKTYTVSKGGSVKVTLPSGYTYKLVTTKKAKSIEKSILKTVKAYKTSVTIKKGKKTTFKMSSKLNKKNVSKITYSSSKKSVATVSKSGKITAKKTGTATVKAKVTLKSGAKKTVTMKVKVK